MGLEEPICGVGGTVTTCAFAALTQANKSAAARTAKRCIPGEEAAVMGVIFLSGVQRCRPIYHVKYCTVHHKMTIFVIFLTISSILCVILFSQGCASLSAP